MVDTRPSYACQVMNGARWERERVILKTAKQEKTINPDTRLHSDEMRENDEKERRLARNPMEETSLKMSEGSCLGNWCIDK